MKTKISVGESNIISIFLNKSVMIKFYIVRLKIVLLVWAFSCF